jgi:hypothetical protein
MGVNLPVRLRPEERLEDSGPRGEVVAEGEGYEVVTLAGGRLQISFRRSRGARIVQHSGAPETLRARVMEDCEDPVALAVFDAILPRPLR